MGAFARGSVVLITFTLSGLKRSPMTVKYFESTDTLYIEFNGNGIVESKDLDENTILDMDSNGNVCAITFEHASQRTDVSRVTLEGIAA
jgi:uncharacterized protein YuzE